MYGKMYVTVKENYCEMEFKADAEVLAGKLGLKTDELKVIQAKYINIGDRWVTYTGVSTGPVAGVAICCMTVVGVIAYQKRKQRLMSCK